MPKNLFGLLGLGSALLGLAVAGLQHQLRPAAPPASVQLQAKILEQGRKVLGGAQRGGIRWPQDHVTLSFMGLGAAALLLGLLAYRRRENRRLAGLAGALGILALAWEYNLWIGAGLALALLLLALLS